LYELPFGWPNWGCDDSEESQDQNDNQQEDNEQEDNQQEDNEQDCGDEAPVSCPKLPRVSVADGTGKEGSPFSPAMTFGGSCLVGYTVDWGDSAREVTRIDDPLRSQHVYVNDGVYTITVTLYNRLNQTHSASAKVRILNVPPKANPDVYDMDETEPSLVGFVLDNDTDVGREDELKMVGFDASGVKGTVEMDENGAFVYRPSPKVKCLAEGEKATESFSYTISDGVDMASGQVNITIFGRRNDYFVAYSGGTAAEEGRTPAEILVAISPKPECFALDIGYGPNSLAALHRNPQQVADVADVENGSGQVHFDIGQATAKTTIIPVDDQVIERNETYYFSIVLESNNDYRLYSSQQYSVVSIKDNEWRFVAGESYEQDIPSPVKVEAFYFAELAAAFNYTGSYWSNLGLTAHSSANSTGVVRGWLTRGFYDTVATVHTAGVNFVCDSQTGDIWYHGLVDEGTVESGPLASATDLQFEIDDAGDSEARVSVTLRSKAAVNATLTRGAKFGGSGSAGAKDKGQASGGIEFTWGTTYGSGAELRKTGSQLFVCRKGE
jgi:VCBS repeat-containing protein